MKKRVILYVICCLLMIIGIGGAIMFFGKSTPASGTLYVNGKEIASMNVKVHSNYADIPLTQMLEGLGIDIKWVDSSTAEFAYDEHQYTLNLAEVTLKRYGYDGNVIIPAPGTKTFHYTVLEKELVLDSNTVFHIMHNIKRVSISIDYEKLIVYVTSE